MILNEEILLNNGFSKNEFGDYILAVGDYSFIVDKDLIYLDVRIFGNYEGCYEIEEEEDIFEIIIKHCN